MMRSSGAPVPTPHHAGDVGLMPWWACLTLTVAFAALLVIAMLRAKGRGEGNTWN